MKQAKTFKKTFFISTIIVSFYSILLILCISIIFQKKTNDEFLLRGENELNLITSEIDSEIQQNLNILDLIIQTDSITSYLRGEKNPYHYFLPIFNEISLHTTYINKNDAIIGVSKIKDGLFISNQGYFTINDFADLLRINSSNFLNYIDSDATSPEIIRNDTGFVIVKKYSILKNTLISAFSINVNKLFFNSSNIDYLVHNQLINLNRHFSSYDTDQILNKSESNIIVLSGETIQSKRSNLFPDLTILLSYPAFDPFKIPNFIWLILTMTLLIGGYIIHLSTKIFYEPINSLTKFISDSFPTMRAQNHNAPLLDEVSAIKNNFSQLKSNNEQLRVIALETYSYRRIEFVSQLLEHPYAKTSDLDKKIAELNLSHFTENVFISFYKLILAPTYDAFTSHEVMKFGSQLLTLTYTQETGNDVIVLPVEETLFFLISTSNKENDIEEITKEYLSDEHVDVIQNVYSKQIGSIYNLKNAYQEGLTKISKNALFNSSFFFSLDDENIINQAIENNVPELAKEKIREILTQNLLSIHHNSIVINEIKYIMLNTLSRLLLKKNISLKEFVTTKPKLFQQLNTNKPQLIYTIMSQLYDEAIDINCQNSCEHSTTSNILTYIKENATSDLSLSAVADYFNLSEQHINRLLKAHVNTTFKTLLTTIRIEKAKTLLTESTLRVADIAEKIGYTNSNSFIRAFKKETGITPKEYSKLYASPSPK